MRRNQTDVVREDDEQATAELREEQESGKRPERQVSRPFVRYADGTIDILTRRGGRWVGQTDLQ